MRVLHDTWDVMEEELKRINKKDSINSTDLECIYKIVDILKDITTMEAMKEANLGNYSNATRNGYSETWPIMGREVDMRYDSRNSYARDGRMSSGYSRGSEREHVVDKLNGLMENARTDEERENYRRAIDLINR